MQLRQLSFYDSDACRSRRYCRPCRARANQRFRPGWAAGFRTKDGAVDFECVPLGLLFDDEPGAEGQTFPDPVPESELAKLAPAAPGAAREVARPPTTLKMAAAWAVAATMGKYATAEAVAERDAICGGCDRAASDAKGRFCAICGCAVHGEENAIRNLAAYQENMAGFPGHNPKWPDWGCKHPLRGKPKNPADPDGPKYGWPLPVLKA
jgi:hypothetical protein